MNDADEKPTAAEPRCKHCGGLLESDPDDASAWLYCPLCKVEQLEPGAEERES